MPLMVVGCAVVALASAALTLLFFLSPRSAVWMLRLKSLQGDPAAQTDLGYRYQTGTGGVHTNIAKAVQLYLSASKHGYPPALAKVGGLYLEGLGVPQDDQEAVRYFRRAAEAGDPCAEHELGFCYSQGRGVEQSYVEAFKWNQRAAEHGDAHTQHGDERSGFE